jgi:hypothetical protein
LQANIDFFTLYQTGEDSLHLVEDKLQNPCLDYVEHIIFTTPESTFVANGQTYKNFHSVRDDFLGGRLSQAELKKVAHDILYIADMLN